MQEVNVVKHQVNNAEFSWDIEKGTFLFDGGDVVLFWIESAFKTLLDSIEEVSGIESAHLVLETAGFRMGLIVADHYKSLGDLEVVVPSLEGTYGAAGWGKMTFTSFDVKQKKAVIRMKHTWEYKVNLHQKKTFTGSFLPGHWAGLFTGLFDQPMWYRIVKSQIAGDEYDEIEVFCSGTTPEENIHDLIRGKENMRINDLELMVEERTKELHEMIHALSVQVIPVLPKIIVIPLIAKYDTKRAQELITKALFGLKEYNATYLLLDLTGLHTVDLETLQLLQKLVQGTKILGATCILVGISPAVSNAIIDLNFSVSGMTTFGTLQQGIIYALAQENMEIVQR